MKVYGENPNREGDKVKVTKRIDPCNCGCCGRDPQHRQHYMRVLHNVTDEQGTATTDLGTAPYNKRATIKAPWSEEPVTVVQVCRTFEPVPGDTNTEWYNYNFGWYVVKYDQITPKPI
jgi:hypothetical protein